MVSNERSKEICRRLDEISAELREMSMEIGKPIHIMTHINKEGKSAATVYAAGYRKDHFYDGYERLSYGQYMLTPEQVIFGDLPKGLRATIELKELKKKRKK